MLKMNEMQSYSYDEAHAGYGDAGQVNASALVTWQDVAISKFFESGENQMFGNPRIGTWGLARADDSLSSNIHSANFTWVDASSMVPTGSWGSPSENFFTAFSNDGHAVSSFDVVNDIPTDCVFLDGVRNDYAFIEDRNLWSIDDQVNDSAKEGGPNESDQVASQSSGKPGLYIQSNDQNQDNSRTKSAGFSSEYFGVARFAHDSMVSYEGGDFLG